MPTTITQYGLWGNSTVVTETAGGITRTTTTQYDTAARPSLVTVTGGTGTTVPAVTTAYDTATEAVLTQTSTAGGTITKAYDQLGRQMSYTDADGGTTSTQYDALNRPTTVTDNVPSTTTYTYDTSLDPRGPATKVTDSVAGSFTAAYDADGDLTAEGLPGGYTMTQHTDPTGTTTDRTYARDSDGTTLVSDSISDTIHDQEATHTGTPGITASQNYTYDQAGRLTQVQDTGTDAVCTTRSYTFDKNSNRKSLATAIAAPNADCTTTGGTTVPSTYDTADRLVNTGYTYDAFGRTTTRPGTTLAYYTDDLLQQQTAGTQRRTWTLDSGLRFRAFTTEDNASGTWTQTAAKVNHYDTDSDSPRWIVEDTGSGALTRNVTGLDGNLAATTTKTGGVILQLADLHGDIALQLPADTAVAPTVLDADEYGNPRPGQQATRYAWLGGKQRSDETLTGLTLMGVRLYDPAAGRFLSMDPIAGGNCNAYDYVCADPVNGSDLDGRCGSWGNPFKGCDTFRILMWSRQIGQWWLIIREGTKTRIKPYGMFGIRHIVDKHVGWGKRDGWITKGGMLGDLKKALVRGNWEWQWDDPKDGASSYKIIYTYKHRCACGRLITYQVTAFYSTRLYEGWPIGVTTAYKKRI
ncbi:RHS repeat-associated core domain-containing protein [Streptomyces polygonati]|uniref:RHS repeat-associated core domain-containing protein n=1 Tax=Streptomyces polygonati TaxID=1617087 RepID=A0ABV8HZB8_9ACTN